MMGSNPSITTTRLAERQQITGISYKTPIQQFKHTSGSKNGRDAMGSNGKTRVDLNSNYSSQILKSLLFFALIQQSTKLNCITNFAVQQLKRIQKHNACLLLPVTSLHYKQMKRKQTGLESRYNATITQQKKDFLNSSTNKNNERKISYEGC